MRLDAGHAKKLIRKAIEQPIDLFGRVEGLVDWLYTNLVEHQIDEFTELWAEKIDAHIARDTRTVTQLADDLPESAKKELARDWLSDDDLKTLAAEWLAADDVACLADGLDKPAKVKLIHKWLDELAT